jgi:hypothetical protein
VQGVEKPSIVPSMAELRKLFFVVEGLLSGMNLFQLVGLSGTTLSADIEPGAVTTCSSDIIVVVSDPSPLITEWDLPWSCVSPNQITQVKEAARVHDTPVFLRSSGRDSVLFHSDRRQTSLRLCRRGERRVSTWNWQQGSCARSKPIRVHQRLLKGDD